MEGGSLVVQSVTKSFGGFVAVKDLSLEFFPGEVHAVLGENGAGKSTLMSLIAGFIVPDKGEITLGGVRLPLGKPFQIKQLGVGMVHQHFTLVPNLDVSENFALARLKKLSSRINLEESSRSPLAISKEFGWDIQADQMIRDLPVGVRQRIEILKNLADDERVLIFDEPTAPMSPDEVENLLDSIRKLAASGKIVILIAHKLSEVLAVADRVSVLRRGKLVGTHLRSEVTETILATMMVGGELPPMEPVKEQRLEPGLCVKNVTALAERGERAVRNVSFEIRRGEILGIGGVDGNGQFELAEVLAGIRTAESGSVEFLGEGDRKVGYIPGDRQKEGLALGLSVRENLFIGGFEKRELTNRGFLRVKAIQRWAKELILKFDIKVPSEEVPVVNLSGGNQQKVVVSRELDRNPNIVIAVNPTRGLDFKASSYVRDRLIEAKNNGAAVALFSADFDELAAVADRVIFLSRGEISEGNGSIAYLGGSA